MLAQPLVFAISYGHVHESPSVDPGALTAWTLIQTSTTPSVFWHLLDSQFTWLLYIREPDLHLWVASNQPQVIIEFLNRLGLVAGS